MSGTPATKQSSIYEAWISLKVCYLPEGKEIYVLGPGLMKTLYGIIGNGPKLANLFIK